MIVHRQRKTGENTGIVFYMTVTCAGGSVTEGGATEADVLRSLRTAVRRGYRTEATYKGGVNITRQVRGAAGHEHTVTYQPGRSAGYLTRTIRQDLTLIGIRNGQLVPETGCIKAGYIASIPPAAAALLRSRGLITINGTHVTISLPARIAMTVQDAVPVPWGHTLSTAEIRNLCIPRATT